jgi:multidrug efflux system membrane fusion protein
MSKHKLPKVRLVIACAALALAACGDGDKDPGSAAIPVKIAVAETRNVPVTLEAVGNVEPMASVAVKSRVDGQITQVLVADGQDVKKGQPLFQIDPRPFEIELQRAQALLLTARAQETRYRDLLAKKFVSTDSYAQIKSARDIAEATEREARLQLEYSSITAPFDGRLGRVSFQSGNLVKANDTTSLVVLNQVDPIYVSFSVPEQSLPQLRTAAAKGSPEVTVRLPQGGGEAQGRLAFIDNAVDAATGTVRLRAIFDNADGRLWPGQFVAAVLQLDEQQGALVVPPQAVQTGPNGSYVFVVGGDSTVSLRDVKVARATASLAVIEQGVAAGDRVVIDGQSRLTPGAKVSFGEAGGAGTAPAK